MYTYTYKNMLHTLNIKHPISHMCLCIYVYIYIHIYIYIEVQPSNIPNFHLSVVDFATNLAKGGRGSGALSDQGQRGALSWVAPGSKNMGIWKGILRILRISNYISIFTYYLYIQIYKYLYIYIYTLDIYVEYHIYIYIRNRHICIYI